MHAHPSHVVLFALIVVGGVNVGCAWPESQEPDTEEVTLFFYSESDLQNAFFDHPVQVMRTVPQSENTADATLRLLFAGPTAEERSRGARVSTDLTRLGPLYLGVRIDGKTAIVNFKREALEILNSAAARQFMAKEPIRSTLLQFPDVHTVEYAIDGVIFDEWDA